MPSVTIDSLLKFHLLMQLQQHDKYDVVEDNCSAEKITYAKAHELIMQRYARLHCGKDSRLDYDEADDYASGGAKNASLDHPVSPDEAIFDEESDTASDFYYN